MRSLHLMLASTLIMTPLLGGCSDDGDAGSSSEASDSEESSDTDTDTDTNMTESAEGGSASASGDGDGDEPPPGDGDGDGPPPGDGDGDGPPPGDGDGDEPPPGDGDGDEPPGDGDGDKPPGECEPTDDTECAVCTAESCCDQLMACEANEACSCVFECIGQALNPMACFQECGIDNPQANEAFMDLRACRMENCGDACQMGGGDNMP